MKTLGRILVGLSACALVVLIFMLTGLIASHWFGWAIVSPLDLFVAGFAMWIALPALTIFIGWSCHNIGDAIINKISP